MRRALLLALLVSVVGGCGTFFEGGVVVGVPTVQVARENFSSSVEKDESGNVMAYNYAYTLVLYPLPGSPRGYVVLLDQDGNPVESPFAISEPCPVQAETCPPVSRDVSKTSSVPLVPVQVAKYLTASLDGQSKVIRLPAPIEVY